MHNNEKFKNLNSENLFSTSVVGIIPSTDNYSFTYKHVNNSLNNSKRFNLLTFERSKPTDHIKKEFVATVEYLSKTYKVYIQEQSIESLSLEEFGLANMINDEDLSIALTQRNYLKVALRFNDRSLESFHLQLKILDALIPEASLVVDFMSYRLLSGKWLSLTAASETPPSPDYLYALHAVYEEIKEETRYWFHTHGLLRCGIVELEILNTTTGPQQMYDLLNHIVKRFLFDQPKENEKFTIGFDGLDLNLTWIRREEALQYLSTPFLGGCSDREGANNPHNRPSGILFAIEDSHLISPEIYVLTLSDNPILFISTEETLRMSRLAKERYIYFKKIFNKYYSNPKNILWNKIFNKNEKNKENWSFLVKLGLTIDNATDESEKEHLWFSVISANTKDIEATLLNQPYWIKSLNEGDKRSCLIENLTDWIIYSPDGEHFTPDSIYQLIDIEERDE